LLSALLTKAGRATSLGVVLPALTGPQSSPLIVADQQVSGARPEPRERSVSDIGARPLQQRQRPHRNFLKFISGIDRFSPVSAGSARP
jgi:hypothetical protein